MKILMISSEAAPYAKTGGLADAVSALSKTLTELGHDVKILIPRYYGIDRQQLFHIDLKHPITFRPQFDLSFLWRIGGDISARADLS